MCICQGKKLYFLFCCTGQSQIIHRPILHLDLTVMFSSGHVVQRWGEWRICEIRMQMKQELQQVKSYTGNGNTLAPVWLYSFWQVIWSLTILFVALLCDPNKQPSVTAFASRWKEKKESNYTFMVSIWLEILSHSSFRTVCQISGTLKYCPVCISRNNWVDNAIIQLGTDTEYSAILSLMSNGRIDWWIHILQKAEVYFLII